MKKTRIKVLTRTPQWPGLLTHREGRVNKTEVLKLAKQDVTQRSIYAYGFSTVA